MTPFGELIRAYRLGFHPLEDLGIHVRIDASGPPWRVDLVRIGTGAFPNASGTTVRVARQFNRVGIGLDLGYHDLSKKRIANVQPVLRGIGA